MPKSGEMPQCPQIPSDRGPNGTLREYRIELLTPMFGGGVEAGEPDRDWPIRETAIRGHLQFWWRATIGSGLTTVQELTVRHTEVWGAAEQPSPIQVEIRDVNVGVLKSCATYEQKSDGKYRLKWNSPFKGNLPYVLFPFQGQLSKDKREVKEGPASYIGNASFVLRLRFPELLEQDVAVAVRTWVNFGGLGARTRRGCGALYCKELAPNGDNLAKDLRDLCNGAVNHDGRPSEWPTLPPRVLVGEEEKCPFDAWKRVIGAFQHFRQGPDFARNNGRQGNRPGRSRYPEPETIRSLTGRRASQQHRRMPNIPNDAFPRADLGLPIVFHFKDGGDPPETTLYPKKGPNGESCERMASPLILKPLALANGKFVPIIIQLVTTLPTGVVLKSTTGHQIPPSVEIRAQRLAEYPSSPLSGSSGSALDAFVQKAEKDWGFREVRW